MTLELTTNLHEFQQQGDKAEIQQAITEICYAHGIEITDLYPQTLIPHFGPLTHYCRLIGRYQQRLFILNYDLGNTYRLHIQQHYVGHIHTFQDLLTALKINLQTTHLNPVA